MIRSQSLFDVEWGLKKMEAEAKRRGQLSPSCERPNELDQVLLDKLADDVSTVLEKSAFNTVDFSRLFASIGLSAPLSQSAF